MKTTIETEANPYRQGFKVHCVMVRNDYEDIISVSRFDTKKKAREAMKQMKAIIKEIENETN